MEHKYMEWEKSNHRGSPGKWAKFDDVTGMPITADEPAGGSVPDATTVVKGIVELAEDGESAASKVVQSNDARLTDTREPDPHDMTSYHTESGLTAGQFMRATGATTFAWQLIQNGDLGTGAADGTTFLRDDRTWSRPTAGIPASTIVSETSYGQSSVVGTQTDYARSDHSHGTPSLPTPGDIGAEVAGAVTTHVALSDPHTQYQRESERGAASGYCPLDSGTKVDVAYLPDTIIGSVDYKGTWNANTNNPDLVLIVPTKGDYYVVSVAGTTSLGGFTDWKEKDWAIYNGSAWEKVDNTDAVSSVNGYTGVVVLDYSDVGAASTSDVRFSDSRAPNGSASGDLGGVYPSPTVTRSRGLRDSNGTTFSHSGTWLEGQILKIGAGSTIVAAFVTIAMVMGTETYQYPETGKSIGTITITTAGAPS